MSPKSILIFNAHSLLVGGVKSLLDASDQFEVASIIFTEDMVFLQEIEQSKPDVIIMDEGTLSMITPEQLLDAFRDVPRMRLVILNLETSRMEMYDKCEFIISHPDHFIEALSQEIILSSS